MRRRKKIRKRMRMREDLNLRSESPVNPDEKIWLRKMRERVNENQNEL